MRLILTQIVGTRGRAGPEPRGKRAPLRRCKLVLQKQYVKCSAVALQLQTHPAGRVSSGGTEAQALDSAFRESPAAIGTLNQRRNCGARPPQDGVGSQAGDERRTHENRKIERDRCRGE